MLGIGVASVSVLYIGLELVGGVSVSMTVTDSLRGGVSVSALHREGA